MNQLFPSLIRLVSASDQTVRVLIPGEPETREVKLVKGKPVVLRPKEIP